MSIELSDLIQIVGKGKYEVCGCTGGQIAMLDFQKPNDDGSYQLSIFGLPEFWITEWGVPPNKRLQPTALRALIAGIVGGLLLGLYIGVCFF